MNRSPHRLLLFALVLFSFAVAPLSASAIAPLEPALAPVAGPGVEQVNLRTEYSRTLRRPDGSFVAYVYTTPIHYRDAQGVFQVIDTTLVRDGQHIRPKASGVAIDIQPEVATVGLTTSGTTPLAQVRVNGQQLGFDLLDLAARTGHLRDNALRFTGALAGADINLRALPTGFAWGLTFARPPTQATLRLLLTLDSGDLRREPNGSVTLLPCAAEPCFHLNPPQFNDANNAEGSASLSDLQPLGKGRFLLTYTLDQAWLAAPERAFPVQAEAAWNAYAPYGVYVQTASPGTSSCNVPDHRALYVGYYVHVGSKVVRKKTHSYLYFDVSSIPSGATINASHLKLYQYAFGDGMTGYVADVHRVTSHWIDNCTSVTWNNQPTSDPSIVTSIPIDTQVEWKDWNITSLTQQWQNGTPNEGLMIIANPEDQLGSGFCSNVAIGTACGVNDSTTVYPYLEITYIVNQPPTVEFTTATNPQLLPFNAPIDVAWQGRDSDGTSLTYTLKRTENGVATTLLTNSTATTTTVTLDAPCRVITFDVTATDAYGATGSATPLSFTTTIQGDFDRNGTIDSNDRALVEQAWGVSMGQLGYDPALDINADGQIDQTDVSWVIRHMGHTCSI